MQNLFKRIIVAALILCVIVSPAAAFDLQVGQMNFNPAPPGQSGPAPDTGSAFGATLTIPIGSYTSENAIDTLNGQALSHFTKQDAKDSLIVIMLFSVAIGLGILTASAASD